MNIIKDLVKKHGMRLEEIAVLIDASFSSCQNWLHGNNEPTLVFQRKLEDLLKEKQKQEFSEK